MSKRRRIKSVRAIKVGSFVTKDAPIEMKRQALKINKDYLSGEKIIQTIRKFSIL